MRQAAYSGCRDADACARSRARLPAAHRASSRRARARRPRRSRSSSAAAASPGRGARASATAASRRGTARATARRRSARSRSARRVYGLDPDPGVRLALPPPALRRLVGRGSALADLQPLPARRAAARRRRFAAAARRSGGRPSPTASSPSSQYNVAPAVPGRGSGDLPARRHRPRDERLRLAAPARAARGCCGRLRPGATISISSA